MSGVKQREQKGVGSVGTSLTGLPPQYRSNIVYLQNQQSAKSASSRFKDKAIYKSFELNF